MGTKYHFFGHKETWAQNTTFLAGHIETWAQRDVGTKRRGHKEMLRNGPSAAEVKLLRVVWETVRQWRGAQPENEPSKRYSVNPELGFSYFTVSPVRPFLHTPLQSLLTSADRLNGSVVISPSSNAGCRGSKHDRVGLVSEHWKCVRLGVLSETLQYVNP